MLRCSFLGSLTPVRMEIYIGMYWLVRNTPLLNFLGPTTKSWMVTWTALFV